MVLESGSGEALWENGEPTEYGVEVYTEGDCWGLAWHLHLLTGRSIVLCGTLESWEHVMVEMAVDSFLDINGESTRVQARKWSPNRRLTPISYDTFEAYQEALGASWMYLGEHADAERVASLVLETYLTNRGAERI